MQELVKDLLAIADNHWTFGNKEPFKQAIADYFANGILASQFRNGEPTEDGEYVVRISSDVAVIERYVIDEIYQGKWLGSLKDTTLVYPVSYCKLPNIQIIP